MRFFVNRKENGYIGIILMWLFHSTHACCPSWASGGINNAPTGKCYEVSTYSANWTVSRSACRDLGAVLGIADTIEDSNYVHGQWNGKIWMGVNDIDTEGVFTQNGKNLTATLWKENQPNGQIYADGQDCVIMDEEKLWQDKDCADQYNFLCEWPIVKEHSSETLKFIKSSDITVCDHETMPPGYVTARDLLFCATLCLEQTHCVKFAFDFTSSDNCILFSYRHSSEENVPNAFQLYTLL